jgi:uncharacterized cupredoxin-like copper-binding protein
MKRVKTIGVVLALVGMSLAACSSDSGTDSSATTAGDGVTVPAAEGTTVNVEVGDTDGLDGPMTMTVSPASVAAGTITFVVKNTGTIEHEMVVLKTDTPFDQLEVDAEGKVSEDTSIGEVSEFAAGTTKSVTLDVEAGSYVLVCNIAKHYGMGMRVGFTVT